MRDKAEFKMRRYALEPGDATRYQFYLVDLGKPLKGQTGDVVAGVGDGREYMMLGICMPRSQGSYEVQKRSLWRGGDPFISYLHRKMPNVDHVTLTRIVKACSVLVDEPDALERAATAMLS